MPAPEPLLKLLGHSLHVAAGDLKEHVVLKLPRRRTILPLEAKHGALEEGTPALGDDEAVHPHRELAATLLDDTTHNKGVAELVQARELRGRPMDTVRKEKR